MTLILVRWHPFWRPRPMWMLDHSGTSKSQHLGELCGPCTQHYALMQMQVHLLRISPQLQQCHSIHHPHRGHQRFQTTVCLGLGIIPWTFPFCTVWHTSHQLQHCIAHTTINDPAPPYPYPIFKRTPPPCACLKTANRSSLSCCEIVWCGKNSIWVQ